MNQAIARVGGFGWESRGPGGTAGIPPNPETYSTERPRLTLLGWTPPPTLSPQDILDLRFFFCEYESACLGANAGGEIGDSGRVGYDAGQVRLIDMHVTQRANRVRDALQRMVNGGQAGMVIVLFRLYGGRPPGAVYHDFRELSTIVDLTDAAETARCELAAREGRIRAATTRLAVEANAGGEESSIEARFWWAAGRITKLEATLARLRAAPTRSRRMERAESAFWRAAGAVIRIDASLERATGIAMENLSVRRAARWALLSRRLAEVAETEGTGTKVGEAHARLAAWREILRRCLEGRTDATRAADTAEGSAGHELTTADAMRWHLEYHGRRDVKGSPERDAHAAWKLGRASFVARVRRESDRLRLDAARAYRDARCA